jgi:hypothetical protein
MDNYGDVDEKYNYKFPDEQKKPAEEKVEYEIEAGEGAEIEVVDDTPEQDRGRALMKDAPADVTDEELAQYSDGVKKRIQHFSKGYHEERRAKEAAQREKEEALRLAQALVEENKKLQGSLGKGQEALLEQAKKVVATEVDEAKRKLKEAHEAFDTDGIVSAQEELAKAVSRAERVNNFRPPVAKPAEPVVQTAPAAPQPDPKALAWQEANSWFGSNRRMTAMALEVHNELVEKGVNPSSEEYYKQIDAEMRRTFPDAFTSEKPNRKSSVVAPATRSTAPKKIVLTQSQVNLAKRLGVPLEVYARSVAEQMRKENG